MVVKSNLPNAFIFKLNEKFTKDIKDLSDRVFYAIREDEDKYKISYIDNETLKIIDTIYDIISVIRHLDSKYWIIQK